MPELRAAAAAGVLIMLSVTVILRMDQPLSNSRAGSDTVMPRPTSEGRAMANRLSRASKDASPAPAPSEEQAVGMPTRLPAGGSADLKERTEVNGAVWRAAAPDRPTVAEAPASMAPPSAGLVAGPGSVTSGKAAATTADGPGDSFAASAAMAGWPVARAKAEPTRTRTEVATLTVVGAADADVIRSVNECLGGTAQDKGDAAESDGADGFEREEQPRAFAEAAPAMASRRRGLSISREAGQPTVIAAAVPTDSYPALLDRLQALGQVTEDPATNAVLSDSSDRSGRSAESALSSALQPADARIPVRIRILPGPATPSP
jgi:hypothetical protein